LKHKKAIIGDWFQVFVVTIALLITIMIFTIPHEKKPFTLEEHTSTIKEQIENDKVLIEYLNTPITECNPITESNIYNFAQKQKITYADLINLFISGNPKKGTYTLKFPPNKDIFDETSKGDEYFLLWAKCTSEYGGFLGDINVIRITYTGIYFDSSKKVFPFSPISSTMLPTKSKDYPVVEVSLMEISIGEPAYEGTMPG